MENVNLIPATLLAALIMGFVQIITRLWPKTNSMQVTLIVSFVISIVSFVSVEAIGYLEILLAVFGQVFIYDAATKTFRQ